MEITGIIEFVGNYISEKGPYPFWILVLLLTAVMLYMTEIMSNVALVTIFLPGGYWHCPRFEHPGTHAGGAGDHRRQLRLYDAYKYTT